MTRLLQKGISMGVLCVCQALALLLFHNDLFAQPPSQNQQLYAILDSLNSGRSVLGQHIDLRNINFATGESILEQNSIQYLDTVVDFLQKIPNVNVSISGHTDNVGNVSDNEVLSLERASAVRDHFVRRGISGKRLSVEGYGSSQPVSDKSTPEGRRLNRRVEIKIYSLIGNAVRVQDVIYLSDGGQIGVVTLHLNEDTIRYQTFTEEQWKWLLVQDVDSINFADGERRVFASPIPLSSKEISQPRPNSNATVKPVEDFLFAEWGFWIEYLRGSRIWSHDFQNFDISDWETNGLLLVNPGSNEGRIHVPLEDATFSHPTHGIDIGMLFSLNEKLGVLGEWQYTGNTGLSVRSHMLGASYDLVFHQGLCLAAISKIGVSRARANLTSLLEYSAYRIPKVEDGPFLPGDYLSAVSNKLAYQIGVRGDVELRGDGVRLNFQFGLGGTLLGSNRFYTSSESYESKTRQRIRFRRKYVVEPDGSSSQAKITPSLRSMGIYFSFGYAGFGGWKRKHIH